MCSTAQVEQLTVKISSQTCFIASLMYFFFLSRNRSLHLLLCLSLDNNSLSYRLQYAPLCISVATQVSDFWPGWQLFCALIRAGLVSLHGGTRKD